MEMTKERETSAAVEGSGTSSFLKCAVSSCVGHGQPQLAFPCISRPLCFGENILSETSGASNLWKMSTDCVAFYV